MAVQYEWGDFVPEGFPDGIREVSFEELPDLFQRAIRAAFTRAEARDSVKLSPPAINVIDRIVGGKATGERVIHAVADVL